MERDLVQFAYHFRCADGEGADEMVLEVVLDPHTLSLMHEECHAYPDWVRLDWNQCDICPLDTGEHDHCPAAMALQGLVGKLGRLTSFSKVETTVTTSERVVTVKTSAQRALRSLIGLLMATSGCPVLAKFKPMARFHLPFATREETVFRSAGAYLLAQYFLKRRGEDVDFELAGLKEYYDKVHILNMWLAARIRHLCDGDAHVNALVLLDLFAQDLPKSIDENLAELEGMFAPFFA